MTQSKKSWRPARHYVALLACSAVLMQFIPFSCGRNILHLVSPILLDRTSNILDAVVSAVAPLVLP